ASSGAEPLPHSRTDALTHSSYPPGVYPLSFAQQRLWLLMQLGTSVAYNMSLPMRFTGALDDWALERALDEIVRRHATLRTRIEERGGEPVQVVGPARPLRLRAEDVRLQDGESVDDALRRMAEEEAARPFAAEGPFLRVRLLRAEDDDHVLLWTIHHLMADGWSLGIFQDELLTLYRAFASETEADLAPLPEQYGEHALRQRQELSGGALDALVEWWRERLAGAPALLELPTDRPRPPHPSGAGASFWFDLAEGTAERVGRVARERGATPFMVLLAAFQALLSRWSGQDDVVVGTPIANRTRPELEPIIGFFANTLAIRGDLSGAPSFDALLARVREATLGAYEHQDVPFERLVEELNPERSLSHTPVFQVMFALQNAPQAEGGAPLEGLELSGLPRARETAQFDLSLSLHERDGGLAARLEYATDLFGAPLMERFAEQFVRLLDAALDDPARPVAALPLLDVDKVAEVLALGRGPDRPDPLPAVHAGFRAQAARTPDAVAVSFEGREVGYGELDAWSDRLSRVLRARGVGPEARVAICLERSVEMVVALLAVLKAGGAYVPVDPGYPAERIAYVLGDCDPALMITVAALRGRVPSGVPVLSLDEDAESIDRESSEPLADSADPRNAAYIIYTSGSTGRPKGVAVPHRALANFTEWTVDRLGVGPDDRLLQKLPFMFDAAGMEFWPALVSGARLMMAIPGGERDPAYMVRVLVEERITVVHGVPAQMRALAEEPGLEGATALRIVGTGGEAMPAALVPRLRERLPSIDLVNLYGPTETCVVSTLHFVGDEGDGGAAGGVPIGTAIDNTRLYVLDRSLRPTPRGVPGELFIAGTGLARGYFGQPGMTADRFVPDPFATETGARMYRTGDRVRWLESAEVDPSPGSARTDAPTHSRTAVLDYLGRVDDQVKVRGFRIELGEIEAVLAAHPAVAAAAVIVADGARLAAYAAVHAGAAVTVAELRAHCAARLPEYMVPQS
ncbi:MAG TPA: amino acid adenylation domain-containing protein, partial [Longimicrobium sp.]|nr:amino acid adenylation domain-containing protein [Longimicrobium sp.]